MSQVASEKGTSPLSLALAPGSVAVIGASDEPHKIGGRPIMFMNRFGFKGRLYPINAHRETVQGFPALRSLSDLPEVPDLAMVVLPGDAAVSAVEQCAAMGVKHCLVLASGFAEAEGPEGVAKQARMVAAARAAGTRVIGPNSQGLANFSTGAITGFSTMFLEDEPQDGPVGIVSQSGGMAAVAYSMLRRKGIGVRYVNATGNDCDVTAPELALAMAMDPDLKLLLLYVESISDARSLVELGRVARERDLPVLLLKGGSTALGQTAAQSHTAALMNEDRTVSAFLEAHGIWRADTLTDLLAAAELHVGGTRASGRSIVSISNSGASCVLTADAISKSGLELAKLHADTRASLSQILPGFASVANPIDITAVLLGNSRFFGETLPVIGKDAAADAFVISVPVAGAGYDVPQFGRDAAAFAASTGKPVVVSAHQPQVARTFAEAGLPVFPFEHDAVAALSQFTFHRELLDRPAVDWLPPVSATGDVVTLSEAESLERLARRGVKVPDFRLCTTVDEAAEAFERLGGAVVLKGSSRQAPHKSELGIVRLGLASFTAVREAFADVTRIMSERGIEADGVLVAPMARGRLELLVGGKRDPVFGPIVTIGSGGKYVEVLDDLAVLIPPITPESVVRAIDKLRVGPILHGVRGETSVALDALTALLSGVADMLADPAEAVESVDLNPVFVDENGATIADALLLVRE